MFLNWRTISKNPFLLPLTLLLTKHSTTPTAHSFSIIRSTSTTRVLKMVEGHSVHRVASLHRSRLVGKKFKAWSPNGRFTEGAKLIDGKTFVKIEAVGKNLFAFFGDSNNNNNTNTNTSIDSQTQNKIKTTTAVVKDDDDDNGLIVVHIHFGMAGNWAVYHDTDTTPPPEPRATNRLRLEYQSPPSPNNNNNTSSNISIIADLHAMTCQHGSLDLYHTKRSKLGQDPLRIDANPDKLWNKIHKSKKSIGALVNDQSYFTGPGNIYRAEILYKAGIHPDRRGCDLRKEEFDLIWEHTVALLQRGYETGSILTVDPEEAVALGQPHLRRYIYNSSFCPRCGDAIKTWAIASRTCYACLTCQPMVPSHQHNDNTYGDGSTPTTPQLVSSSTASDCVPFNSHCARESVAQRLKQSGPTRLTVKELTVELIKRGVLLPTSSTTSRVKTINDRSASNNKSKKQLLELFYKHTTQTGVSSGGMTTSTSGIFISSEDAAAEKAVAGESLAIEHIAELAPIQARIARARGGMSKATSNSSGRPMKDDGITEPKSRSGTKRSKSKNSDKKRKVITRDIFPPIPYEIPSSNDGKRVKMEDTTNPNIDDDVTVFISSKRAAIKKSIVGTISTTDTSTINGHVALTSKSPLRKHKRIKSEETHDDDGITVIVSSKHADITPTAVGTIHTHTRKEDANTNTTTIHDSKNDGTNDHRIKTLMEETDIQKLTVTQLKLELGERGIKANSKLNKEALRTLLQVSSSDDDGTNEIRSAQRKKKINNEK